jgi:hypothetical protein
LSVTRQTRRSISIAVVFIGLLTPQVGAIVTAIPAHASVQTTLYVDAAQGDDANSGADAQHAFRTIDKARQAVRTVNSSMTGDIVVQMAPGNYYLSSTLTFGRLDSGTNGYDVIYQGSDGVPGSVHVIGGNQIDNAGWTKATSADVSAGLPASVVNNVYKIQLPAGTDFNTLYVDGSRAVTARTPNAEPNPRFAASDGTTDSEWLHTTGGDQYSITWGSDMPAAASNAMASAQAANKLQAQFVIWSGFGPGGSDWYQETLPIGNVDTVNKRLTVVTDPNNPAVNRTHWTYASSYRYFVQNFLGALDSPREFYFDKSSRTLYYYPVASGSASELNSNAQIIAPVVYPTMQKAISFKGDDKAHLQDAPAGNQVHNIVLRGLTVEDTDFGEGYVFAWNSYDAYGMHTFPVEAGGTGNAFYGNSTMPSYAEVTDRPEYHVGAITLTDANHIQILDTRITNAGMNGIEMFRDNDSHTIKNTAIDNTGMGGLDSDGGYPGVGKYNDAHTVDNVQIHDAGQLVGSAPGITIASTGHSTFDHLEIFNVSRRGILLNAGYKRRPADFDANYNPMTDMYTIGNHFSHIYVHHCQQDGGEDSCIFGWALLNRDLVYQATSPHTYDPGADHDNYLDQILIDSTGANPTMHDKNTVHGLDFPLNQTGVVFSNIKSTNVQSFTLSARSAMTFTNTNYNQLDETANNTGLNTFNDAAMDYANIGTTSSFPSQFAVSHPAPTVPANVYFSDDFESGSIDTTNKWIPERGNPTQSTIYMAEGPYYGKKSLAIDTIANPNGVVLSRRFSPSLNKIVTMQFFDKRIDYATSDIDPKHYPHSFGRVDDGVTQQALGADGTISKDFYLVKSGNTTTVTSVPRAFGWHELKWDYTSGTGVTMFIDGQQVATASVPAFSYLSVGDDTGVGIPTYFDDIYIYGGAAAPPWGPANPNMALTATATASSQYSATYAPSKAADGDTATEWASNLQLTPWYKLTWPTAQAMNTFVINERPNLSDHVLRGTLTFSDGSTIRVPALPNDGKPYLIQFPRKIASSVTFQVDEGVGYNVGLSEFQVYDDPTAPPRGTNVALNAGVTSSSTYGDRYAPGNVIDGITGQQGTGEFVVGSNDTAPWVRLTWPTLRNVDKVVLYDRSNTSDWVQGGTLTFSDGSSITVPALPNNGTPRAITFAQKAVKWVQFDVTKPAGLVGLSEFQAWDVPDVAQNAVPSTSTAYTANYSAANLTDGGGMANGADWAATNADAAPWAKLTWDTSQTIDQVVLSDRPNATDQVISGTLTFSDGSSVPVGTLNNFGTPTVIRFASKTVTWVQLDITGHTGLAGIGEFGAYSGYAGPADANLASSAVVTGSSRYSASYDAANVADGNTSTEWAKVNSTDNDPHVTMTWTSPQIIGKVVLFDRANNTDQVLGGYLKFSDGTTESVGALPNGGGAQTVTFTPRYATSVEFHITSYTGLPGLSEMQVNES